MQVITTARLHLVPLTREMVEQRLAQPEFGLTLPLPDGEREVRFGPQWPGEALAVYPMLLRALDAGGSLDGTWVVVEDGAAVGQVGTTSAVADGVVEIGYGVNEEVRGRGVATEAVRALVDDLLARDDVRTVTAQTAVDNLASQQVLRHNGFSITGRGSNVDDDELVVWARPR